jgi:hypothetical protein
VLNVEWRLAVSTESLAAYETRAADQVANCEKVVSQLELSIGSINVPMNSSAPVFPSTIA